MGFIAIVFDGSPTPFVCLLLIEVLLFSSLALLAQPRAPQTYLPMWVRYFILISMALFYLAKLECVGFICYYANNVFDYFFVPMFAIASLLAGSALLRCTESRLEANSLPIPPPSHA
jgi:hypothetical protein